MAYNSLQNKFKTIEEKIDKTDPLQVSAYPKNSSIQHLSVQRAELKSEIEVLKDDQYRLDNSPEYLKHFIQEIKLDIKRLKKQKKRLQKESKGFFLDRYLNRIKKKQRLFLAEKKELETIVSELEKDYKSLASDISTQAEKSSDLNLQIEILKERKAKLIQEKEAKAFYFGQLKNEIEETENRLIQLRKEISNIQATNKLLNDNTEILKAKQEEQYKTANFLQNLKKSSENQKNIIQKEEKKLYETSSHSNTVKLDKILNVYKNDIQPRLQTDQSDSLKELYKFNSKGFDLLMKIKSELSILLEKYDFEDSGVFDIKFSQSENSATLFLSRISVEKNILDTFFKTLAKSKELKYFVPPSVAYRYTVNKLVKELRFKLELEVRSSIKTPNSQEKVIIN